MDGLWTTEGRWSDLYYPLVPFKNIITKMVIKNKYIKCVLVGLGNIGVKYDINKKDLIQTHTKGIINNKNLKLICGVDKKKKKKNLFKKKYQIKEEKK